MNNYNKRWTAIDVQTMKEMAQQGASNEAIAKHMGRTTGAVGWQMSQHKVRRQNTPTPSAKFVRYMAPKKEVSLLWGLFKYSKS